MARSIKIGHCVCDPRQSCPCALFKEKNVCTCAGERVPLEGPEKEVRLTEYVRHAGCASKVSQKDLHEVLKKLPAVEDPRLIVGTATADDAGVFELTRDILVVQTVDVFTPGVDDSYTFGRIAACNSLSDVYAMGGRPITALSVIGFPVERLPLEVMADIIRGGMDVLAEAETILLGGHSINDEEVKFGFAVTGLVNAAGIVTNAGAKPGNRLVLTKPLGTGIVSLAAQVGRASPESIAAAERSMTTLNRKAAEIMVKHGATACTDITGFGLLGHLAQMVVESKAAAEIWCDELPLFPGVPDYVRQGFYSGANERNADYSASWTEFSDEISEEMKAVLYDAQTSGGLLIAFPQEKAFEALEDMRKSGLQNAAVIGRITGTSSGEIRVEKSPAEGTRYEKGPSARGLIIEDRQEIQPTRGLLMTKHDANQHEECCAPGSGTPDLSLDIFQNFMGTALKPGALDVVTKELIAVALGLAVNCVPCSKIHIKKARDMGIGEKELEEAAAIATAFGGCRAMMLWNELKKENET